MKFENILKNLNVRADQKIVKIPGVGRGDLAKWLKLMDFKIGVEVGSAGGAYLETLCKENPQMHLIAVDSWQAYKGYSDYKHQRTINGLLKEFHHRMAPFDNFEIKRGFSIDVATKIPDVSLDFVYIDANHNEPYITEDITEWSKKVRPGGIVAGHDYVGKDSKNWQVKEAIEHYVKINSIVPLFVLGTDDPWEPGGRTRDVSRSWMFIKP